MTYALIHTIKFIIGAVLLTILFLCFNTQYSHAYFTTDQQAVALDGSHTGLFTIDYAFGMANKVVHLPIRAEFSDTQARDMVSYTIVDQYDNIIPGKVHSMVLSDANVTAEGTYMIPKGIRKDFKLAVFFTPTVHDTTKKYRLQVTYLPFTFDTTQQLQLNPSELRYYTTKAIGLNE